MKEEKEDRKFVGQPEHQEISKHEVAEALDKDLWQDRWSHAGNFARQFKNNFKKLPEDIREAFLVAETAEIVSNDSKIRKQNKRRNLNCEHR
jgi:hypothetical protein